MGNLSRFRNLIEDLQATAWEIDASTRCFSFVSKRAGDHLGYPVEAWLDDPDFWLDHVYAEDRSDARSHLRRLLDEGVDSTLEYRFVAADGRLVWLLDLAHVVTDADGKPEVVRGVTLDVTERREHEERSRREKEAGLRVVAENMPILLWTTDKRLRVTSAHGAALSTLNLDADQVKGMSLFEYFGADDPEFTPIAAHRRALKGHVLTYERELMGRTFHFHVEPLRDRDGNVTGTVGAAIDITERKSAEDDLRRSLELLRVSDEARAELLSHLVTAQEEERRAIAGGIHDDTIQVLGAINLHLGLLRQRLEDPEQLEIVDELEQEMGQAMDRLRRLLFQLRPPALDSDGLVGALQVYLERMRSESGVDYTLVNNLTTELSEEGRTIAYRVAVEALTNVRKHAEATTVNVAVEEADGGALVRIRDDGRGFAADGRRPEPGHLGLVGMRERAELAGGWFKLDSSPGAGTTVEFWIPATVAVSLAAS